MAENNFTLDLLEALLDNLTIKSDDYLGTLPIDLAKLNLCAPAGNGATLQDAVNGAAPNTMEEIEELCNSDYIKNLLDTSTLINSIQNMVNDVVDKRLKQPAVPSNPADSASDPNNSSAAASNLLPLGNIAIVEFGDDYTNGDKVEYQLYVKPGDILTSKTIMGQVKQYDTMKQMRSIFASGIVLSTDETNKEFLRLYPSKATRHILIGNYKLSDGVGFDDTVFANLGDEISLNTELYNLIKDHACYSTLPLILANHESKEEHEKHPVTINPVTNVPINNCDFRNNTPALDLYNDLMDRYIKRISSGGEDIVKIVNAKNIKATLGTNSGMNKIKDQVFEFREKLLNDIIAIYQPAADFGFNRLPYDEYKDCYELSNLSGALTTNYESFNNSGQYSNYYAYLISSIDKTLINKNSYYKEYYNILSSIIAKRNLYESDKSSKQFLIDEFNNLYKDNIREYTEEENKLEYFGYNIMSDGIVYKSSDDENAKYNKVYNFLINECKRQTKLAATNLANLYIEILSYKNTGLFYQTEKKQKIEEFNVYFKLYIQRNTNNGYDTLVNKKYDETTDTNVIIDFIMSIADNIQSENFIGTGTIDAINRIARLYMYICTMDDINEDSLLKFTDEYSVLDLLQEEATLIRNFWIKTIAAYKGKTIDQCIDSITKEAERLSLYAEWPNPTLINIEGLEYAHYLFKNPMPRECNNGNGNGSGNGDGNGTGGDNNNPYNDYDQPDPNVKDYNDCNTSGERDSSGDAAAIVNATNVNNDDALNSLNSGDAARESDDDPKQGEITVVDTEYWVRYFALATVISLPFLADGFDIPPVMAPTPLPGIYIAFKAIHIKIFDVVIVMGLAIRGIWIFPIVLIVNLSDNNLSVLTPLIAIVKQVLQMFQAGIETIEMTIPNIINLITLKLEKENENYRKQNQAYEALLKTLKGMMVENSEVMKNKMRKLVNPNFDPRQNIYRTADIVKNAVNDIKEKVSPTDTSTNNKA